MGLGTPCKIMKIQAPKTRRGGGDRPREWMRGLGIGLLGLLLTLGGVLWQQPSFAQAALNESRISRLEFVVQELRSQVQRLSSQSLPLEPQATNPPFSISQPPSAQRRGGPTQEQFENLANLVIELKEEVRSLQSQVDQLQR